MDTEDILLPQAGGQWQRLGCVFLLATVFALGMLTLPALPYDGDPFAWQQEARALVLHGALSVTPEVAAGLGEPGHYFILNAENGQWYSKYGSFNGLMNVLPLAAEKWITGELPPYHSARRVLFLGIYSVLVAMAIAAVVHSITGYYTASGAARTAYVLLAFYTTYLWNYLRSATSEPTQLLLLALCHLFFLRWRQNPSLKRNLYLAWLMLLALCQTRISYLALLPLFALVLLRLAAGMDRAARRAFIVQAILAPIVLTGGAQAVMQTVKFGSPFLSGYHQFYDPPLPHTLWSATADFLWGGQGSLFIHFPLLLVALFGARKFARRNSLDSLFLIGCFAITYILVAPPYGPWRGEWAYGPRYFVCILPLLALPALYPLEWMFSPPRTWKPASLVVAGLFLACVQMQVNRLDYFFKYKIEVRGGKDSAVPEEIKHYFAGANFARINWDHLRARGDFEKLPYFSALKQHADPATLEKWKQFVEWKLSQSNLYWFPDNNMYK